MTDSNDLVQQSIVIKPNDIKNGNHYLTALLRGGNVLAIHQCRVQTMGKNGKNNGKIMTKHYLCKIDFECQTWIRSRSN